MKRRNIIVENMWSENTGDKACTQGASVYGLITTMGV